MTQNVASSPRLRASARLFTLFFLSIVLASGVLESPAGPAPALAADADAIAKETQTLLRSAERDMHGGKKEQADQKLEDAAKLIQELKDADPEHAKLNTVESKYTKLRKDLDKRMAKSAPAETGASGAGAATATQASTGDKLPAGVTKRIKEIDTHLAKVDGILDGDASPEKKAKNAAYKLTRATELLGEIDTNYGAQIPADDPEYQGAKDRVAERQARIATINDAVNQSAAESAAATQNASKDFEQDKARIQALYDKHRSDLDLIHGNTMVYGVDTASAQSALDALDGAEKTIFPELQPALAEMAPKYGTDAMSIGNLVGSWGYKGESQFANQLEWLIEAAQHVPESRVASAESIARNAKMNLDGIESLGPEVRMKRMQQTKDVLQIGQQLDPNNSDINGMLATIDQQMSDMATSIESDIDAKTWAGHVSSFAGPGTTKGLAKATLDYFRADRAWGGNPDKKVEILAVAVRGPWKVAEKDIFGRVTRWRLPIHLAVTDDAMRAKNIAKVFDLSIVAMEGAGDNAPKEPPFDGFWVGANWMMRLDKL